MGVIGSAEPAAGRSPTVDHRSSRSVTIRADDKITVGMIDRMATPGDVEKTARKTIHLHRLFDRKSEVPQREQHLVEEVGTVSDRVARPAVPD